LTTPNGSLRTLTPPTIGYLAAMAAALGTNDVDSTLGAMRYVLRRDERQRGVLFPARIDQRRTRSDW